MTSSTFFEAGGTQMGKRYSENDWTSLMNKFDFDDELNYLPHSFKQQAQKVCNRYALPLSVEFAKDTFISLVQFFETG